MTQKAKRKQALRIFMSYDADDRAHALNLEKLLSQRLNVRIFTTEMLSAGKNWQSKLRDELSKCDIFLALLSPNSVNSTWVLHEVGAAWVRGKPIIFILTNPEVLPRFPVALEHVLYLKLEEFEKPEIINRILEHYEEVTTVYEHMAAKRYPGLSLSVMKK